MITLKKKLTSALMAVTLGLSITAQAEKVRLGHITPPSHIWHQVAERFGDNLEKATAGDKKIKIFPLAKLGGDDQMIDLLQSGAMQLAVLTAGSLSNRSEPINAWFMPYAFKDVSAAAVATQSAEGQRMLANLKEHKLVGLGYTLAGMRHVISSKPISSTADFENKKIRAFPNQVFNRWWSDLGAAPTALAIGDVSSALTTNLLDGVDVDLDIVVGLKMYQQAPYLTLTNHMAFPGVVVASEKWWNRMSEAQRKVVLDAFKEAEAWGFKKQAEAEISNLALLKKAGVTVDSLDTPEMRLVAGQIVESYTSGNAEIASFYNSQAR